MLYFRKFKKYLYRLQKKEADFKICEDFREHVSFIIDQLIAFDKTGDDFFIQNLISDHKKKCHDISCFCKEITKNNVIDKKEWLKKVYKHFIEKMRLTVLKFPTDVYLVNFYLYSRLNLMNNTFFIHEFNWIKINKMNSSFSYLISQFMFRIEMQQIKNLREETMKTHINWMEFSELFSKIEDVYSQIDAYLKKTVLVLENLHGNKIPFHVILKNFCSLSKRSAKIQSNCDFLIDKNVKYIIPLYIKFLDFIKQKKSKVESLTTLQKEDKMKNEPIVTLGNYDKSFIVRVSVNLIEFCIIKDVTKNVKKFLFYDQFELKDNKINYLMENSSALKHDVKAVQHIIDPFSSKLSHPKSTFLVRKSGFIWKTHLNIKLIPFFHLNGYEYYCFCEKMKDKNKYSNIMIVDMKDHSIVGINENLFRYFGIGPIFESSFKKDDNYQILNKLFPKESNEFWNNKFLSINEGLQTTFDFAPLMDFSLQFNNFRDKNENPFWTQQYYYFSKLKSLFEKKSLKNLVSIKEEENICYSDHQNLKIFNIKLLDQKLIEGIESLEPNFNFIFKKKIQEQNVEILKKETFLLKTKTIIEDTLKHGASFFHQRSIPQPIKTMNVHDRFFFMLYKLLIPFSILIIICLFGIFIVFIIDSIATVELCSSIQNKMNYSGIVLQQKGYLMKYSMVLARMGLMNRYVNFKANSTDFDVERSFLKTNYTPEIIDKFAVGIDQISQVPFLSNYVSTNYAFYGEKSVIIKDYLLAIQNLFFELKINHFYDKWNNTFSTNNMNLVAQFLNSSDSVFESMRLAVVQNQTQKITKILDVKTSYQIWMILFSYLVVVFVFLFGFMFNFQLEKLFLIFIDEKMFDFSKTIKNCQDFNNHLQTIAIIDNNPQAFRKLVITKNLNLIKKNKNEQNQLKTSCSLRFSMYGKKIIQFCLGCSLFTALIVTKMSIRPLYMSIFNQATQEKINLLNIHIDQIQVQAKIYRNIFFGQTFNSKDLNFDYITSELKMTNPQNWKFFENFNKLFIRETEVHICPETLSQFGPYQTCQNVFKQGLILIYNMVTKMQEIQAVKKENWSNLPSDWLIYLGENGSLLSQMYIYGQNDLWENLFKVFQSDFEEFKISFLLFFFILTGIALLILLIWTILVGIKVVKSSRRKFMAINDFLLILEKKASEVEPKLPNKDFKLEI